MDYDLPVGLDTLMVLYKKNQVLAYGQNGKTRPTKVN